jgi:hypothetical protein
MKSGAGCLHPSLWSSSTDLKGNLCFHLFAFQNFQSARAKEASMSLCKPGSVATALTCCLFGGAVGLYGQQAKTETPLENAFQMNLMVQDTNGDQIADAVCGHVIVPKTPSAAENASAANLAARLGYETSALTLPIVVPTGAATKGCSVEKASLWVGREALSAALPAAVTAEITGFGIGEGGVFNVPGGLLIAGSDPSGLLAAADVYSARAPYQWSVQGEK